MFSPVDLLLLARGSVIQSRVSAAGSVAQEPKVEPGSSLTRANACGSHQCYKAIFFFTTLEEELQGNGLKQR